MALEIPLGDVIDIDDITEIVKVLAENGAEVDVKNRVS